MTYSAIAPLLLFVSKIKLGLKWILDKLHVVSNVNLNAKKGTVTDCQRPTFEAESVTALFIF